MLTGDRGKECGHRRRVNPVDEIMSQIFNRKQQVYELIAEFFGEDLIEEDEQ